MERDFDVAQTARSIYVTENWQFSFIIFRNIIEQRKVYYDSYNSGKLSSEYGYAFPPDENDSPNLGRSAARYAPPIPNVRLRVELKKISWLRKLISSRLH